MRTRRWVAAGLAVGALLGGCGDESGTTTTIDIEGGPGGGEELFEAMARARREAGTYHAEIKTDGRLEAVGRARVVGSSTDVRMTVVSTADASDSADEFELVFVDGVLYGFLGPKHFGDTPWVILELEPDALPVQQFALGLDMPAYFRAYSDFISVDVGGEGTVDGIGVTEYVVSFDIAEAQRNLAEDSSAYKLVENTSADRVSFSVWLDASALIRRLTYTDEESKASDWRFFDYGEPVDIEAPDPAKVLGRL